MSYRNLFNQSVKNFLIVLVSFGFVSQVKSFERRDTLWHISSQCTKLDSPAYCDQCAIPIVQGRCNPEPQSCEKTVEIWSQNEQFFAMRDIKMCGCPANFVHGLVIPKSKITGIEDPKRPKEIWSYAWQVASDRMPLDEIGLAVNPLSRRSQNQLHVHIARLKKNATHQTTLSIWLETSELDLVWQLAEEAARQQQWIDYGILVSYIGPSRYQVQVTQESPEYLYTQAECVKQDLKK